MPPLRPLSRTNKNNNSATFLSCNLKLQEFQNSNEADMQRRDAVLRHIMSLPWTLVEKTESARTADDLHY